MLPAISLISHRYPDYPNTPSGQRPPGVAEYKQMLLNIVQPMLSASTSGPLRLLTVSGSSVRGPGLQFETPDAVATR